MSPEQAEGMTAQVGSASDIFSLGVILYELVTGERPFEGGNPDEIRSQIRKEDAIPVSHKRRGIPRDLETIISKCLEKSPNRRYATARDFADDLGRFLRNEPIVARPTGYLERALKYSKRKPTVVAFAASAVVGLLLIAGLVGAWISDRISAADEIAAAQTATAVAEEIERQHQYVSNIQHAAEALRHGKRREVLELLEQCHSLAPVGERRGIECDWIWAEANRADRSLHAHATGVSVVRFSPRDTLLASGGKDGRVILWDTNDWASRFDLKYSADQEVNAIEFSADGSLLAVGGDDGRLVVYRMADRAVIYDERIIDGRIFELAWVGDSTRIAAGGDGSVLSIVDPVTREHRRKVLAISEKGRAMAAGHPEEISGLIYIRSRHAIAAFLSPPTAFLIDPDSLEVKMPFLDKDPLVGAVCDLPFESGYLAATTGYFEGGGIELFRVADGALAGSMRLSRPVQAIRYSPAANEIAVAFRDGTIRLCDVKTVLAEEVTDDERFCAHSDRAASVDFSPDGTWLASGGWDGDVKLWHLNLPREPFDVHLRGMPVRTEFSPCGRWLAIALESEEGSWLLSVLDAQSGMSLWSTTFATVFDPSATGANSWVFAFDPLGDEISVTEVSSIQTFDARTGERRATYSLPKMNVAARLASSSDGRLILVRWPYSDVLVLDRRTRGKADRSIKVSPNSLGMFSTIHGDVWVDVEASLGLAVCTAHARKPIMELQGPSEKVEFAAVSQDGRYLAASGHEGIIYFWDLNNSKLQGKCVGHESAITEVVFSPDGRGILSRSHDGTVRLWDLATRAELLRFGSPQKPIVSMALNPDGTLLIFGIKDGSRYGLRIYRLGENSRSLLQSLQSF
jgi:WD40 repeat protein